MLPLHTLQEQKLFFFLIKIIQAHVATQATKSVRTFEEPTFVLPTHRLGKMQNWRSQKPGGNASFLPLKWLLLILVSLEDTPRLMGILVGLTLQQFLIEKKH